MQPSISHHCNKMSRLDCLTARNMLRYAQGFLYEVGVKMLERIDKER